MKRNIWIRRWIAVLAAAALCLSGMGFAAAEEAPLPELPEGVRPVTWEVSPDHLMIETEEARALYEQITAGDYPTMEELKENPVVKQLDALSAYYKALYGNTAEINTPGRTALRNELKAWFLTLGSARAEQIDADGNAHYAAVPDGELKKEFKMEIVLGLPASGKSTRIANPDSNAMNAFILDPDMIKEQIPEYRESHGAGADAIHFEGMDIFNDSLEAFLTGDMKGTNVVLPIVITDTNELLEKYIRPFEEAGYTVKIRYCYAEPNAAAARVVMRELGGGQLINSMVAFEYCRGVEKVWDEVKVMTNTSGEPYGFEEDDAAVPAA